MKIKKFKKVLSVIVSLSMLLTALLPVGVFAYDEGTSALSAVSSESWMSVIRDDTYLTEITIPGTHDSCARKFANEDAFGVLSGISKCQNLNITQQLNAGIRFLDIRCEADASSYSVKTVHGSTDCWNGDDYYYLDFVLQDVYNWLDAHPSETVLISVKEDDGSVGAPAFTEAIYQYIHGYGQGKYFYGSDYNYNNYWYLGKEVPHLSQVRGKCVLFNRFDQYIQSSGSSVNENESGQKIKWNDQGGTSYSSPVYQNGYNNNTGVGTFHVQDHYEWSTSNKISATQDMLNLGHYRGEYYFNFSSTTEGASIPSPKNCADTVNPNYFSFNYTKNKPSGIYAIDFATSDIARKIIENNEGVCTVVTASDGSINYTLNRKSGVLTISGNGNMKNYAFSSDSGANGMGSTAPWGDQPKNSLFEGQYNSDLITSVVIDEGIGSIGNYAFYGFDNLTSVTIPSSVKSIGEGAFTKCSSLRSIDISDKNISSIGAYAFKDCTALTSFKTAECVNEIGENAFQNTPSLVMYGSGGTLSQSYAQNNNIRYIATGAYDAQTDWFISKSLFSEPFNEDMGGTGYTNTAGSNGEQVSYEASHDGRDGVVFLPWSIERTGNNYIDSGSAPFADKDLSNGVTISFFREISGNFFDGAALTFADNGGNYFAIYDNGKMYFNNATGSFSYETEASDCKNKEWQFITVTATNTGVKLYVNGRLNSTYNYQSSTALVDFLSGENTKLYYGSYIPRGTCSLYLDEVSLYDFAVNATEQKAMYLSYETPQIYSEAQCAADADVKIYASDGWENVIYTHGENTETVAGLNMAADYMFRGDEIADGDNDGAYYYSTSSAGCETELYTTLTLNSKYSITGITDNYSNNIGYTLLSEENGKKTYKLYGALSSGYTDGTDDNITLEVGITDGEKEYTQTKFIFVTPHPVSSHAASAVYKGWTSGTSSKSRDSAVLFRADGSTGMSLTYYSGNYVFVHTPVFIGNGWCFASNYNADNLLMMGDGKQGDDTVSAFPTVTSKDITNAGCYAQHNSTGDGEAISMTAEGTTANYYIDKSVLTAGKTVGGVHLSNDGNTFTTNTIVTRLAARSVGTGYYWSNCGVNTNNGITFSLDTSNNSIAEAIGTRSNNDDGNPEEFNYAAPTVSGSLSNGNEQSAEISVGINHSDTNTYFAGTKINFSYHICDKSVLRNLVNTYENEGLTGKGASKEDWKNYLSALGNAYKNLNNYKSNTVAGTSSIIYTKLVAAHNAFTVDTSSYDAQCANVLNALDSDKVYSEDTFEYVSDIDTAYLSDQTSYDILAGRLSFVCRFAEELNKGTSFGDIDSAIQTRSNPDEYNQSELQRIRNGFYSAITRTVTLSAQDYTYYSYYNQDSYDSLVSRTLSDIENAYMYYSVKSEGGSSVVESENPFKNKNLSKGVTISFDKYSQKDNGWNASLLSFSSGNRADNRYFIIMGNGTVLFNDGNGGSSGNNGCYFDINATNETNTSAPRWVNVKLTIYKNDSGRHILDYYVDNSLARRFDLSTISASGYPAGLSGNDGIFSFLASPDIKLYYGASFSVYGTMAGTTDSYLDNVGFYTAALSPYEISQSSSEEVYSNNEAVNIGGNASAYVNTNASPFASSDLSQGCTVSFFQSVNSGSKADKESLTLAQGATGECKYFTIGTDGFIRFNNGDNGSDPALSGARLFFDCVETNTDITDGTRQLITVSVIDDYHINVYVNGALSKAITVNSSNATQQYLDTGGLLNFLNSANTTLYLGSYTPYWGAADITLSEVKLISRALSSNEVEALYRYETNASPSAVFTNEFTSCVPDRVSGSCEWVQTYENKNGVLHIPAENANGNITYFVDGVEVTDVSNIKYGSAVKAVYRGAGTVTEWSSTVTNPSGSRSFTVDDDDYEFTLTGNTVISYLANQTPFCRHKHTEIRNASEPSCTETGYSGDTYCADCEELLESGEVIPANGHSYESTVNAPTCTEQGYTTYTCTVCSDSYTDNYTPASGHNYQSEIIPATPNERGYTLYTCSVCSDSYRDNYTPYASDSSVLEAALDRAQSFNAEDYTPASYQALTALCTQYSGYPEGDYSQSEIDFATTEILSAINLLRPYLYLKVESENCTATVNNAPASGNRESAVFGDSISFSATPNEGYTFYAWYETVSKRILSKNAQFTYTITSNTDVKAICIPNGASTLTFANDTGQIVKLIHKAPTEWQSVSVETLEPDVPFKFGYTGGVWNYTESDVISALTSGNDVTVIPIYTDIGYDPSALPIAQSEPALSLTYAYNSEENIGSFILSASIPDGLEVESIGTAIYYEDANTFDPTLFDVNITNKTVTSKFDEKVSGTYTTDILRLGAKCNFAVKGYVTYYDKSGNLVVSYSNQVNVVNKQAVVNY
ncbi:MAG: leucine-rich repeat protein [Eubacterium sp.]|nr:leucine-rich repeat protein [Eubacterium sp.]